MISSFSVCVVVRDRPVFLVQAVRSVLARRAVVKAVPAGWELGKWLVRVGG